MFRNETNYVLTNGVLLDGTEKMTPQTGRDIYIEGGRIGAVGQARLAPLDFHHQGGERFARHLGALQRGLDGRWQDRCIGGHRLGARPGRQEGQGQRPPGRTAQAAGLPKERKRHGGEFRGRHGRPPRHGLARSR